jgi:hypothetical protein
LNGVPGREVVGGRAAGALNEDLVKRLKGWTVLAKYCLHIAKMREEASECVSGA